MSQKLNMKEIVESIFRTIPDVTQFHNKDSELYIIFDKILHSYFNEYEDEILDVAPFDGIIWPHVSLGNIHSYYCFMMVEFIVYSFYWVNRANYKTVFDIGANIGPDSVILDRFGYEVYSFEPNPYNYDLFVRNIQLNGCKNIHPYQKAISDKAEVVDFIGVRGNTTASHIAGVRDFHGEVDRFKVETITLKDVGVHPDLLKINVEGHEKAVVASIDHDNWKSIDAFVEVHNQENRSAIFSYFKGSDINIFSQSLGWEKVENEKDIPIKEEYIFISGKPNMPW